MREVAENFKVGDLDKYTVVIFIEGSDPDCIDALIGGEIDLHMNITEEHIPQQEGTKDNQENV